MGNIKIEVKTAAVMDNHTAKQMGQVMSLTKKQL